MDFDPELLRAILGLGGEDAGMQPAIDDTAERVKLLRQMSATPQMGGNGRVQVAASPLEHLASGISGFMGGQQQRRMADMKSRQAQIRDEQNRRVLDALIRAQGIQQPIQQQQMDPYGSLPRYGQET